MFAFHSYPFKMLCLLWLAGWFTNTVQSQTDTNFVDNNGKKQGLWIKTDKNGKKLYQGHFINDQPVDTFYYYDYKERLKAVIFFKPDGYSESTVYYPDGKIAAKGSYYKQQKTGEWQYFDGNELLSSTANYLHGKKDGLYIVYYDNGDTSVITSYQAGLENGLRKEFWPGGIIKFNGEMKDDNPNGEVKYYTDQGKLKTKGYYNHAVRDSVWFEYGTYGVEKITTFKNGVKKSEKTIPKTD